MGKLVRWTKRGGWVVGLTPFEYHLAGREFFHRYRFKGSMLIHNQRKRPR